MLGPSKVTPFRIQFARMTSGLILDCAAGTGEYHPYLGSGNYVSLDFTLTQLKNINGKRLCADATRLPFHDNTFDCIWACALIHYIKRPLQEYINEWRRVAKDHGKIFILTPNKNSPFDTLGQVVGKKPWAQRERIVRLYSVEELQKFGRVFGEIQFLPFLNPLAGHFPQLGHTLMLEMEIKK